MAKVTVYLPGGAPKEVEASTVGELKSKLTVTNYTAAIKGYGTVSDEHDLEEDDVVRFATNQKGGR